MSRTRIANELFKAIRTNEIEVIRDLTSQGVSITDITLKSFSLLEYAVAKNNIAAFNLLLNALLKNRNLTEKENGIPKHLTLLQNPTTKKTPWHLAAELGYYDFFKTGENETEEQKKDRRILLSLQDQKGQTVLHLAANYSQIHTKEQIKNKKYIIRKIISENMIDPTIIDSQEKTALHVAISNGCLFTTKELLKFKNKKSINKDQSLDLNQVQKKEKKKGKKEKKEKEAKNESKKGKDEEHSTENAEILAVTKNEKSKIKQSQLFVELSNDKIDIVTLAMSHKLIRSKLNTTKISQVKKEEKGEFNVVHGLTNALESARSNSIDYALLKKINFEQVENPREILESTFKAIGVNVAKNSNLKKHVQKDIETISNAYRMLKEKFDDIDKEFLFQLNDDLKNLKKHQAFIETYVKLHLETKRKELWWQNLKAAIVSGLCPASTVAAAVGSFGGLKWEPISTLLIAAPVFLILCIPITIAKYKSKVKEYDEVVGETIHFEWLSSRVKNYDKKFRGEFKNIKKSADSLSKRILESKQKEITEDDRKDLLQLKNRMNHVKTSMRSVLEPAKAELNAFGEPTKPKIALQHLPRQAFKERQWQGRFDPQDNQHWAVSNDGKNSAINYSSEVLCAAGGVITMGTIGAAVLSKVGIIGGIFAAGFFAGPLGIAVATVASALLVTTIVAYTIYKTSYTAEQKATGERNRALVEAHEKCKNGCDFSKTNRLKVEAEHQLSNVEHQFRLKEDQTQPTALTGRTAANDISKDRSPLPRKNLIG